MSAYRNDLEAARTRAHTLEKELGESRRREEELVTLVQKARLGRMTDDRPGELKTKPEQKRLDEQTAKVTAVKHQKLVRPGIGVGALWLAAVLVGAAIGRAHGVKASWDPVATRVALAVAGGEVTTALERNAVAKCCAAIKQDSPSAPAPRLPYYMAALAACDYLAKQPNGQEALGSVRAALGPAPVPNACE